MEMERREWREVGKVKGGGGKYGGGSNSGNWYGMQEMIWVEQGRWKNYYSQNKPVPSFFLQAPAHTSLYSSLSSHPDDHDHPDPDLHDLDVDYFDHRDLDYDGCHDPD